MANPLKQHFVRRVDLADTNIGTTQPSPTVTSSEFPSGDLTYHALLLEIAGSLSLTASGAGTILANGGLQFFRALRFETDKHGPILENCDGLTLARLGLLRRKVMPFASDITSAATGTPAYSYFLELPFFDHKAARPVDAVLDMALSRPTLTISPGIVTDFISGGTYSTEEVASCILDIFALIDPGPIVSNDDLPIVQPYYNTLRIPISQTSADYQIPLPYGDRNIKRLLIEQRNGSTLLPLDNTVIGANASDRVTFKVNGYPWVDRRTWRSLQRENASKLQVSAMPTGAAMIDFAPEQMHGAKLSDSISLISNQLGTCDLFLDVTSVANGQIWVTFEAVKALKLEAKRPEIKAPAAPAR